MNKDDITKKEALLSKILNDPKQLDKMARNMRNSPFMRGGYGDYYLSDEEKEDNRIASKDW